MAIGKGDRMTDNTEINISEYKIGHTTYLVKTIFNPTFKESLSDILKRLIVHDCESFLGETGQKQERQAV